MPRREYRLEVRPEFIGKRVVRRYPLPKSLNTPVHWRKRREINEAFKHQVLETCGDMAMPKLGKAKVEFEHHTTSPRDRDNLATSIKPILDALVTYGVIEDDSDDYCDLQFRKTVKVKHRPEEKLIIYVTPL